MKLTHISLCSGIGGIDLAFEWAGFETIAQCETDEYASKVLAKNFKGVHNFGDIRTITDKVLEGRGIKPGETTVLSAGIPCQPYSLAGKGKGDADSRDLWEEFRRVSELIKPRWCLIENTPGLYARANQRYFRRVLDGLAEMGYTACWGMWGACDVGALHERKRIFIIANSDSNRRISIYENRKERCATKRISTTQCKTPWKKSAYKEIGRIRSILRNTPEPYSKFVRDDNGLSIGVDRLRCLGNAVVPRQIYPVAQAIAEIETSTVGAAAEEK